MEEEREESGARWVGLGAGDGLGTPERESGGVPVVVVVTSAQRLGEAQRGRGLPSWDRQNSTWPGREARAAQMLGVWWGRVASGNRPAR